MTLDKPGRLYGLLTLKSNIGEDSQRADSIKTLFGADKRTVLMLAHGELEERGFEGKCAVVIGISSGCVIHEISFVIL